MSDARWIAVIQALTALLDILIKAKDGSTDLATTMRAGDFIVHVDAEITRWQTEPIESLPLENLSDSAMSVIGQRVAAASSAVETSNWQHVFDNTYAALSALPGDFEARPIRPLPPPRIVG